MTTRVALIGAGGHGLSHRRVLQRLLDAGRIEVAGLCDRQPVPAHPDAPLDGVPFFTDHTELLSAARPDVVVICTPPHTHLAIALDVFAAGADLLLEKPPVMSLAEHERLAEAAARTGRILQIGFQALGSAALAELCAAEPPGDVGVTGAWWRPDTYYQRAPWAGKRLVDGRPVLDGALVNPLAHAVMQSLAVAAAAGAGEPVLLEAERYRTRDIEVDDTAFARITFAGGLRMMAAVTLAGEDFIAGEVIVTGSAGRAVLEYPTDTLDLAGTAGPPGRVDLLENLVAHRRDRAVGLVVPLERTAGFTAVVQALTGPGAAEPALIDEPFVAPVGAGPERVQVIPGINAVLREAAETLKLPSESGVAWAVPAHPVRVPIA